MRTIELMIISVDLRLDMESPKQHSSEVPCFAVLMQPKIISTYDNWRDVVEGERINVSYENHGDVFALNNQYGHVECKRSFEEFHQCQQHFFSFFASESNARATIR